MKSLGWYLFIALAVADVVGVVMLKLTTSVSLHNVVVVSLVVFALMVVVLWLAGRARRSAERREARAQERIAELERENESKPNPTPHNGPTK